MSAAVQQTIMSESRMKRGQLCRVAGHLGRIIGLTRDGSMVHVKLRKDYKIACKTWMWGAEEVKPA